ncbi:FAD-dependent oxidoreductase [Rubrobacter radiotolerans]|nr:FAD-dependent oxidoreductase [Rubrobacter radiotolerans]MDX5892412.1 FAD-dependent oxidoreductase [Rubrobacter radiotolerans]
MQKQQTQIFSDLEDLFGERVESPGDPDALAVVSPESVEEVRRLAGFAGERELPLVAVGAGTGEARRREGGAVLVDFRRMRAMSLPEHEGPDGEPPLWVEVEPGATWAELVEELRHRQRGLAVYPTSAPQATVGGWVSDDGLGIGSFEYGRLRENVLAASLVADDGRLLHVSDRERLDRALDSGGEALIVRVRVRTRRVGFDRVFAAAFNSGRDLVRAAGAFIANREVPLWHLAFVSPTLAAARGHRSRYILFGVYPALGGVEVWHDLRHRTLTAHGGEEMDPPEANQVWGERFFPVVPGHPVPQASRSFLSLPELERLVDAAGPKDAFQGVFSGSGEVLVLTLGPDSERSSH